MLKIDDLIRQEETQLAPYAARSSASRGRQHPEQESPQRTPYMRDRDRVVHCHAFRRLEYKTQVFVNHEGDHYRTRLTHTLEASQIARSVARILCLNEDLVEALALSHDLGHTPFGHSGERQMDELMTDWGGFDHNVQTLRVVDQLERRYPEFPGLNLTFEVREGIVKHSAKCRPEKLDPSFEPQLKPTLEAQLTMIADEIAYNNHDLDDGLRGGMFQEKDLEQIDLWQAAYNSVIKDTAEAPKALLKAKTISRIISLQVEDLIRASFERLQQGTVDSLEKVRQAPKLLIDFSDKMKKSHQQLKVYLYRNLYTHHRVIRMEEKAKRILREIFHAYRERPEQLPGEFSANYSPTEEFERILCDYIAGMTDRFALEEHRRLFDPATRV